MNNVHLLFWFDVEDCTVPQSDDAARRLPMILGQHGVRGTFKVVGQKARTLEQRVRYRVIDELQKHDIGFHANWHGLRPQIAEYLGPLDWDDGVAEFERREGPGLEDVRRLFGTNPVTYGQPGSNWAPHVFPVLRKWGIPTYVSGFGFVGVDCQPFWYGGTLCTSHMYGQRFSGEAQRHLMGLNFELGRPGELEKHKEAFARSHAELSETGGLISIINHPCTLVLEEWFCTYLKPRELTEAGYRHFEEFVAWALSFDNVKPTCASELTELYADGAAGRSFSAQELLTLASGLSAEANFQRLGDATVSAAEAFGMLVNWLHAFFATGEPAAEIPCVPVYNPTARPGEPTRELSAPWNALGESLRCVAEHVRRAGSVPNSVRLGDATVAPEDFLGLAARSAARLLEGGQPPAEVRLEPVACRFEDYVDEAAARNGWNGAMLPDGFSAPGMLALAKLQAWTLKPAVLRRT